MSEAGITLDNKTKTISNNYVFCTYSRGRADKSTKLKLCGVSVQQSVGSNPGSDTTQGYINGYL